jgi:hypothetical protein
MIISSRPFPSLLFSRTAWQSLRNKFSPDAASLTPLVVLLLLCHLLLWTGLSGISHRAPDLDNMEELVWGNAFEWGYYKHPPLPSWVLYCLTSVFGRPVWLTFFAGQLSVVMSLWFVWRLGCEMTSQKNALIATLLLTPITYFTVRGVISNHNTIQLCSVAACLWMFYRVWRYEKIRDWLILGFCCGLAMLTKYSALVQFAVFFLFLLYSGSLFQKRTLKGIAAASAVFLLMLGPHIWWLSRQAKSPVGYASAAIRRAMTVPEQLHMLGEVLGTTLVRLAPMALAMSVIMLLAARRQGEAGLASLPRKLADELRPDDRFFIYFVGLGPLVLTFVAVLLMRTRIIADWTTTFFLLFGFLAFWVFQRDASTNLLRTCIKVIVWGQIVLALGYAVTRGPLASITGRAGRSTFPGEEISRSLLAQWNSHVRAPLTVVAADTWLGGNIAIHAGRQVDVLIDGDLDKSPWITARQAASCGMLVALNRSPNAAEAVPPKVVELMSKARFKGSTRLPWTSKSDGPQVVIEWGIIPPLPSCNDRTAPGQEPRRSTQ